MNVRTTLALAVLLGALTLGYLALRPRFESVPTDLPPTPRLGASAIARDLVQEKPGDVVKVVCRAKGKEEWVFEKLQTEGTPAGEWRMTSPLAVKVLSYELDRFGRQLVGLQYEVSYQPGEPGAVTAAEAGLDPPEATVTLTDAEGLTVTVEIGNPAPDRKTYARLAGSKEIVLGKADLWNLIKDKPIECRDKGVFDFDANRVTRVEIDDRTDPDAPVAYAFVKDAARWMLASPVTARATSKVDEMLRAMSRLRVTAWQDDQREKLRMYGLEPAALTVRATVSEVQSPKVEGPESADLEPSTLDLEPSTVYELHLSSRSPIGEETKTYLRIGDEAMVATLMKSTADKFKPVMDFWRDMRITTADTAAATRIELSTPQGSVTLVKKLGRWSFDADQGPAEEPTVKRLLGAIADLTAVTFLDGALGAEKLGWDRPQAEIRLTIPGVEDVERITVGGYTDATVRRLVYVRRGEVASVAKVRAADVAALIERPLAYRDRTLLDVHPNRFRRIALSVENRFDGDRTEVTIERDGDAWAMVAPVTAPVRDDRLDQLVDQLSDLRAVSVVADPGAPGAFGLHAPAATIVLVFEPVAQDQPESADEATDDQAGAPDTAAQPSIVVLNFTQHDGRFYAQRGDRRTIYEVAGEFYEKLFAEYRTADVLHFDNSAVERFSIRSGEQTHVFERLRDRWIYQAEPDLPLDSGKVENLLVRIGDLKTDRYVRHGTGDAGAFGLSSPLHEVIVTVEDGVRHVLRVSDKTCDRDPNGGFYALVDGRDGAFLLTPGDLKRFEVSLDALEAGH